MSDLGGKVAVVTGASKGIGAGIAQELAAAGASVVVNYAAAKDDAERVVASIKQKGGKAIAVQGDVSKEADVKRLFAETKNAFGPVDVLVNNAGVYAFKPLEEVTEAEYRREYDINVLGPLLATKEAVAHFNGNGGSIINVSSVAARHGGGPGAYLYAGAKGFVSTATRGLAKELALENIRVNAVAPGVIQTPFHDRFSTPQMLESFRGTIPMGRIGEPDECVGAFLYLASAQLSGYVTGQILEVNGGQYMP